MSHKPRCPAPAISSLEKQLFDFIRGNGQNWGDHNAVREAETVWKAETSPERIELGGRRLVRINIPDLAWSKGKECGIVTGNTERKITHFHADIATPPIHVDYFKFIGWGPLYGVEGVIVSRDGVILAAGGHWGAPPAGGRRNWPLAVDLGAVLLTARSSPGRADGNICGVAVELWADNKDHSHVGRRKNNLHEGH